jgi:tripartite-type tricarboxylate transporter receptor subunit TctC
MFKKILAAIFMVSSLSAWSAEKISVVWGFNPASNQANFYRAIVNELNQVQNKYEFVFESRPGAGGAIAAKYVLSNSNNAILGGTSTFFLRSHFDTQTGYSTSDFQPVLVQTLGAPLILISKKHQDFKSATATTPDLTVSVSGFGSSSHLMASVLKEAVPHTKIVNYVSLVDANKDIMGQHIDAGWNFLADVDKLIESKSAQGLAITGKKSHNGIPTFGQIGISGFDNLTSNTAMYASAKMSKDRAVDLHNYLREVNRNKKITDFYAREYSQPADMNYDQTRQWYTQQEVFWTVQSKKVKPF